MYLVPEIYCVYYRDIIYLSMSAMLLSSTGVCVCLCASISVQFAGV